MSTYVLVHGAWYGSWCWKRVRKALQAAGHEVFTPTLTGVGERSHLNSDRVSLQTHIDDVAHLIQWEGLKDVILCGHSYGGCVISGVADRLPDRIRSLVFLDAFVLRDGECLFDLVPTEQATAMREQAKASGDGWKVSPIPAEVFNVNSLDCDWVNSLCTPHPLACFEERIKLTGGLERIKDISHIIATGFREGSPFPESHRRAKEMGWKTHSMACGHDVMLDLPEELTKFLVELAPSTTIRRREMMSTTSLKELLPREMTTLRLEPLFIFQIEVKPPSIIGATPGYDRRIGEITGGRFESERLRGKILSGGSDWQSLRADGTTTLNVRLVMQTDDGDLIGMTYLGMRHGPTEVMERIARGENVSPSEYYMRATPYYETASQKYGWLNRIVSVAYGHRMAGGAIYQVFEVL
jgi:pimeloyl-ACP methyl ester carboxylesterase